MRRVRKQMTKLAASQTAARLEAVFGPGRGWTSQPGASVMVWETPAYLVLWTDGAASEAELRKL